MTNYAESKVYKIEPICNHDEGEVYIGSTTKKYLSQRKQGHKTNYISFKNKKGRNISVFQLFDKYGLENCQIYLLENVNAKSKDELLAREGFYIKSMQCVNRRIAGRTQVQYNIDNAEQIKNYHNRYYLENKEIYNERSKIYMKEYNNERIQCECGGHYSGAHKNRHNKSKMHQTHLSNIINNSINEP